MDSVIGHGKIREALGRALTNGRLSHAYLFVGPDGVGKTTVAEELFAQAQVSDTELMRIVRRVDEKTDKLKTVIVIAQIREAVGRLSMTSLSGGRKAVFIEEADRLQEAAVSALLKTLEEPRGDALIILRASSVENVPATIASRCQIVRFNFVPERTIADALAVRGAGREEAGRLARLSSGRPGVALRLFSDSAFRAESEAATERFHQLTNQALPERLKIVADILPKDENDKATVLEATVGVWERELRELLLESVGRADALSQRWERALRAAAEVRQAMKHNIAPQLALEHIVLSF